MKILKVLILTLVALPQFALAAQDDQKWQHCDLTANEIERAVSLGWDLSENYDDKSRFKAPLSADPYDNGGVYLFLDVPEGQQAIEIDQLSGMEIAVSVDASHLHGRHGFSASVSTHHAYEHRNKLWVKPSTLRNIIEPYDFVSRIDITCEDAKKLFFETLESPKLN